MHAALLRCTQGVAIGCSPNKLAANPVIGVLDDVWNMWSTGWKSRCLQHCIQHSIRVEKGACMQGLRYDAHPVWQQSLPAKVQHMRCNDMRVHDDMQYACWSCCSRQGRQKLHSCADVLASSVSNGTLRMLQSKLVLSKLEPAYIGMTRVLPVLSVKFTFLWSLLRSQTIILLVTPASGLNLQDGRIIGSSQQTTVMFTWGNCSWRTRQNRSRRWAFRPSACMVVGCCHHHCQLRKGAQSLSG